MKLRHLLFVLPFAVAGASAEEMPENLIDQVIEAYGGEAVTNLESLTQLSRFIAPATGQSHSSQLENLNTITQRVVVDFAGERVLFDSVFESRSGLNQGLTVNDGETSRSVNLRDLTWTEANNGEFYAVAGGTMRMNDAVLAYHLAKSRDDAEYLGTESHMNRPHHLVSIPFPMSPDLTLYIDDESKWISRMTRPNPVLGQLDYIFSDQESHNGVTYAGSAQFFVAGKPNLLGMARSVEFNVGVDDEAFSLPEGVRPSPHEQIDVSEMSATRLADGIYHVGQNGGFTLFIDSPEGLIATGGVTGLESRLAYFREQADNHRPLAYKIITHHHWDHLAGVADAHEAGAMLVIVEEDVETVKELVDEEVKLMVVDKRLTLGSGRDRVEIYDVSTTHAAHFLVTYLPRHKLLFMADHLGSGNVDDVPTANLNTVSMHLALTELDLDIDRIAVAHGKRIFRWRELERSVADYQPATCKLDRPVCIQAAR